MATSIYTDENNPELKEQGFENDLIESQFAQRQSQEVSQSEAEKFGMENFKRAVGFMEQNFNALVSEYSQGQSVSEEGIKIISNKCHELAGLIARNQSSLPNKKEFFQAFSGTLLKNMLLVVYAGSIEPLGKSRIEQEKIIQTNLTLIIQDPEHPLFSFTNSVLAQLPDLVTSLDSLFPGPVEDSQQIQQNEKGSNPESIPQTITVDIMDQRFENISQVKDLKDFVAQNIDQLLSSTDNTNVVRLMSLLDSDKKLYLSLTPGENGSVDRIAYAQKLAQKLLNEYVSVELTANSVQGGGHAVDADAPIKASINLGQIRRQTNTDGVLSAQSYDIIALLALSGNSQTSRTAYNNGTRIDVTALDY